jgi:invasion protein IalB
MKVALAWLLCSFALIAIVAKLLKSQRSVPQAKKIRDHHRGWHKL